MDAPINFPLARPLTHRFHNGNFAPEPAHIFSINISPATVAITSNLTLSQLDAIVSPPLLHLHACIFTICTIIIRLHTAQ